MIKHGQQPGEQPTGMWGSTWSVPGTTSNTLSWLRVSRMYRSFSGHISRHVPTKVLALSRSVLFTRAKQNQVKSKNVPYRYWEAREVHFHNDKRRNKNKNSLTKEKKNLKNTTGPQKRKALPITSGDKPSRPWDPPGLLSPGGSPTVTDRQGTASGGGEGAPRGSLWLLQWP